MMDVEKGLRDIRVPNREKIKEDVVVKEEEEIVENGLMESGGETAPLSVQCTEAMMVPKEEGNVLEPYVVNGLVKEEAFFNGEESEEKECPISLFYNKTRCRKSVMPFDPSLSDDDTADTDYFPAPNDYASPGPSDEPPSKRQCLRPLFEELDEEAEEENGDKGKSELQTRPTTWKKMDINNTPLADYRHTAPSFVERPQAYFYRFFSPQLIHHITYQTNLYATQKNITASFSTTEEEIVTFVAVLLYMGIVECPSLDDYWAMDTRIPQVADLMSSKRFRLLRRIIHFNDNSLCHDTLDRFYKVRPLFTFLNEAFRKEPQTPKQSIDEVIVAYKGKTAGNLRQYVQNRTDKRGFKLFARASEDGIIHDMVLYQGQSTVQSHDIPLTLEQETLSATSQIVSVLASTVSCSSPTAIFADNFFTSLEIARHLQARNCRYTGTARENRIGKPPLKSAKEMSNASVPRGSFDYATTDDGIMALRWKDNKVVTILSTDLGAEPVSKCLRYSKDTKKFKVEVKCPNVIMSYNANMGGINKSDMLVSLYRTPMKAKRWYMRLFAYCLDLAVTNAWLCYRRDCKALGENGLCLKKFRVQLYLFTRNGKPVIPLEPRSNGGTSPGGTPMPVVAPRAIRGQRCQPPDAAVRFDSTLMHIPLYMSRQTCKHCSRKGHIIRTNYVCEVCKVHLCLNGERNCFRDYHQPAA